MVQLDEYLKHIKAGNEDNLKFVFTDESYIHQNHQIKNSYLNKDERENGCDKKLSKGRRLIIMHAITCTGVLVEKDENGEYVCNLKWNGDTPHPQKTNKLTTIRFATVKV